MFPIGNDGPSGRPSQARLDVAPPREHDVALHACRGWRWRQGGAVLLSLCALGVLPRCAAPVRQARPSPPMPALRAVLPSKAHWRQGGRDALARRMRQLAAQLRPLGIEPGPWSKGAFLAGGERDTWSLPHAGGPCILLVALAAPGIQDLDASLFAPTGTLLAEDVETHAQPALQYCGRGLSARKYLVVRAYQGAGDYLVASFVASRAALARAVQVLGHRPAGVPTDVQHLRQARKTRAFVRGVRRRGFRPMTELQRIVLPRQQRVRLPLPVQPARCYTVGGFATAGLKDVDLQVRDEEGQVVASDIAPVADAALQFCAQRRAQWSLHIFARRGAGAAQLALLHAPTALVGGETGLWLGRRRHAAVARAPLAERLVAERRAARALGYQPWEFGWQAQLVAGEARRQSLRLPARRCVLLVAVGGAGTGMLGLQLRARRVQRPLQREVYGGAAAHLRVCTRRPLSAHLLLRSRGTGSSVALLSFIRPTPAAVQPWDDAWAQSRVLEVIEREAVGGGQVLAAPQRYLLRAQEPTHVTLNPSPGCLRLYLVAGGHSAGIDALLLQAGHKVQRQVGSRVRLHACVAAGSAPLQLQLRPLQEGAEVTLLRYRVQPASGHESLQ